jgi:hypothetical protein
MDAQHRFDPGSIQRFRVVDRTFDSTTRIARLRYAFDDGEQFEELITFETEPTQPVPALGEGFDRALLHLHIAAGTSYYKAAAPPVVEVESTGLTAAEREFHRRLYDDGLREFAVTNGMSVPRTVLIRSADRPTPAGPPISPARTGGLVVPIGGGKDSMVLIEAVRSLRPRLFAVNPHPLTIALAEQSGLELVVVRRRLSPTLTRLNRDGALNGHVPITAIISLIAVVGSFLYGYDAIAMAVERSASEETVLVDGVPVNHQFSKSLEFERLLAELVAGSIDPGLVYGSALRPYSELAIGRAFAGLGKYQDTFCSCNTAFRQGAAPEDRWCGHCPKCRFVALVLAPFLTPEAVAAIIGRDLFADPDQIAGFAALMSDDDKPFECVGERRESAVALRLLADQPAWKESTVVAALADGARALVSEAEVAATLTPTVGLDYPDPEVAAAVRDLLTGTS